MASTPATVTLTTIPEELTALILSKLPIKSLLRSISVCKRWRSIISDPQFHKTNSLFLVARHGNYPTFYTIDDESSIKYLEDPRKKVTATTNLKNYSVSNSCNGLVLISIDESLFLFNPLTRYCQKVLTLGLSNYSYDVTPGFCYDASANDYKAILGISRRYPEGGFVTVASLREKNWGQISIEPFNAGTLSGGPVVNGRMHWTARKKVDIISANRAIIWFDVSKNVFEELPSPNTKSRDGNAIVGLGILDGCLCMAHSDSEGSVEVLRMKEYGVAESWTSMFVVPNASVDRFKGDFTPLLVKKNGDVIVRIDERVISVYSVSTGLMMNVGFPINSEPVYVASFRETLVSPLTTIAV